MPSAVVAERKHGARVILVAAVWMLGVLPLLIGQRCAIARLTHHACPGCGLTRAGVFLLHGEIRASLAMHPLLVPVIIVQALLVLATLHATWTHGAPWDLWKARSGRGVVWSCAVVCAAMVVLWALRASGLLGGPVPV